MNGVLRTRVGYSGGKSTTPSYKVVDLHTEVVEIDYDPDIISYEDLIDVFFASHNETLRPYDQRVKSLIFYRNESEYEIAKEKLNVIRALTPEEESVFTELKSFEVFYLAEPEHQNRSLKLEISLYIELEQIFGSEDKMLLSILVSKLNGYIYGYGDKEGALELLEGSGLSDASKARVVDVIDNRPYDLQ